MRTDNHLISALGEKISKFVNQPHGPTKKQQVLIDQWLDQISGELKRVERLARSEKHSVDIEPILRKKNRIKQKANRLDDYKNIKGNKEKVRHPSKYKRWKGVFCIRKLLQLFYRNTLNTCVH